MLKNLGASETQRLLQRLIRQLCSKPSLHLDSFSYLAPGSDHYPRSTALANEPHRPGWLLDSALRDCDPPVAAGTRVWMEGPARSWRVCPRLGLAPHRFFPPGRLQFLLSSFKYTQLSFCLILLEVAIPFSLGPLSPLCLGWGP